MAIGIFVGLATGFWFERRATKAAHAQNEELQRELVSVRHSVYTMGGAAQGKREVSTPKDIVELVLQRARAFQDPEGRLVKGILISYFIGMGHSAQEIEETIDKICTNGDALSAGKWLEMT